MLPSLRQLQQPIRFGLVGLSGVVVNTTALWALARGAHLPIPLASVLATETAILSNFMLNDRWTFRAAARRHRFLTRLARFNGISLGGMVITAGLLLLLIGYAGLHLLLANLLAIGGAMSWNYFVNSRWTWRGPTTDDRRPTTDDRRPTTDDRRPTTDDRQPAADMYGGPAVAAPTTDDSQQSVVGGQWSVVSGQRSAIEEVAA